MNDGAAVPSSAQFGATIAPIRRCSACGHGSIATVPAAEVFEGAYTDALDEVSLDEEAGQMATSDRDLALLERWVSPGRLLDVGCWTGSLVVAASRRGWKAEGLEPSEWASERAKARGADVRQTTLDAVALQPCSYDAIVAADVIEHVIDPRRSIAALCAALRPGGALFITVPDAGSRVARMLGRRWWSVLPMHVQYFTRTSMGRLLERNGFELVHVGTHPKAFSVGYYADRLAAFLPILGRVAPVAARGLHAQDRIVAPNFRDRMIVIATKLGAS